MIPGIVGNRAERRGPCRDLALGIPYECEGLPFQHGYVTEHSETTAKRGASRMSSNSDVRGWRASDRW